MVSFQPNMKLILEAHECLILRNDNRLHRDTFLLNRSKRHCNVTNILSAGSVKLGAKRFVQQCPFAFTKSTAYLVVQKTVE